MDCIRCGDKLEKKEKNGHTITKAPIVITCHCGLTHALCLNCYEMAGKRLETNYG